MYDPRKVGFAALAALLALPIGAGAVYAASTGQNGARHAVVAPSQARAGTAKHDAETADDNEPKAGPDTDTIQEGPGNTAEGSRKKDGPDQETSDKNERRESPAR